MVIQLKLIKEIADRISNKTNWAAQNSVNM